MLKKKRLVVINTTSVYMSGGANMINDQITNTSELTPLELAKFILSKIIKNKYYIEKMSEDLDSNGRLVLHIVNSFIDTGWAKRNVNGTYAITTKCKIFYRNVKSMY